MVAFCQLCFIKEIDDDDDNRIKSNQIKMQKESIVYRTYRTIKKMDRLKENH